MLEKKEHPAKDYQYWYGERTDIPFKKVQESRENDIHSITPKCRKLFEDRISFL